MSFGFLTTAIVTSYMRGSNGQSLQSQGADATLSHLKLIGLIKEGEKLHINKLQIKPISWWTIFERVFYNENRNLTLNFFENTTTRVCEIIEANIRDEKNKMFCCNAVTDLINSVRGLDNSRKTYLMYHSDRDFASRIETLIQKIQNKLVQYEMLKPDLFADENFTDETFGILIMLKMKKIKEEEEME